LRNNYDVQIAAERVQEARANFRVSRSDLYPSFDYFAGVSRSDIKPGAGQLELPDTRDRGLTTVVTGAPEGHPADPSVARPSS